MSQALSRRLAGRPLLDFLGYTLRGVGQVIFALDHLVSALLENPRHVETEWKRREFITLLERHGCLAARGARSTDIGAPTYQR